MFGFRDSVAPAMKEIVLFVLTMFVFCAEVALLFPHQGLASWDVSINEKKGKKIEFELLNS